MWSAKGSLWKFEKQWQALGNLVGDGLLSLAPIFLDPLDLKTNF